MISHSASAYLPKFIRAMAREYIGNFFACTIESAWRAIKANMENVANPSIPVPPNHTSPNAGMSIKAKHVRQSDLKRLRLSGSRLSRAIDNAHRSVAALQ